ncbi:AAA family ATPase [Pseudomonas guariconensis]|uniref:ATP-dependent nuclease n=1 Tax=Pseudomonas guariconensis TaxID=1288410 RepID=UPI00236477A1|nr:AAA family ATPase [Pseudomonas guariconensis]MDD2091227.1 AAA family ATPase [Pseudomonas guariconensis]
MKIEISKFKKIDKTSVTLDPLNIFIGSNNTGKSSFIQGIQFAISACQTLELLRCSWKKDGSRTLSLDSGEFLYTPTKNIESLHHGKKLTGARRRNERSQIEFTFKEGDDSATVTISKGKNGGFTTLLKGKKIGQRLGDMTNPFCVYVPGIAGIPTQEKYEVAIAVKKSAARGDSNNYLRNILYSISKIDKKWSSFLSSVKAVYGELDITVLFDENKSEYITVNAKINSIEVPLDAIGTGLLQVIQIFAYIEYFSPKLILLDEPDAHIHPTKQRNLATELSKRADNNPNLKIVFSTHSRYILESLEGSANVTHFQNGFAFDNIRSSSILIDIGAADSDYLFGKKELKYVIATEDKVDNISEKKEFLKKFLISNGLKEEEFVLHSYEGCTKVHFAKILEGFVRKHIPGARVILHIDRDQKLDTDNDLIKLRADSDRDGIALFITKYQEIESYFCLPKHLHAISDIPLLELEENYQKWVYELEGTTKEKLSNFILRDRPSLGCNKDGKPDIKQINSQVENWVAEHKFILTPGKELLGKAKNFLQHRGKDPNSALQVSEGLICQDFQRTLELLN